MKKPILMLFAACCILYGHAQRKATLTIQCDQVKNTVSPDLHGIFFEEISHGGEGGLYAEMVRNRGFEDNRLPQGTTLVNGQLVPRRTPHYNMKGKVSDWTMPWEMPSQWPGWNIEKAKGSNITLSLDATRPLNAATPQSLVVNISHIDSTAANRLNNEGFWGMGVKKAATYDLQFYVQTGTYKGKLEVSLVGSDGKILSSRFVPLKKTGEWQQVRTELKPLLTDDSARLAFTFNDTGNIRFDFVSLFPRETFRNRPNGLRKDLAQYLANLRPAFVRWPGGCYVEGINVESAPNWKRTIGPVEQRPGTFSVWGYWSSDGFGYHEYLQFCEDIGADALYVFNAGVSCEYRSGEFVPDDSVQYVVNDVLDAIEYAIGPVSSRYGAMRAANGHPSPFPLRYIEVGNEQHGPWYAKRYNIFHDAIKRKYPEIKIISAMGIGDINRWTLDSIRATDIADEHAYKAAWWSFNNYDHFDNYKRGDYEVYVGEYATNAGVKHGNMLAALNDAAYIMGMENNGDLVKMSSYAPLFENVYTRHWPVNLIRYNGAKSFARISYYTIKLFNEQRADENLRVQLEVLPRSDRHPRFSGGIGLATWDTQTEYRDIEVWEKGKKVYQSDFINRESEWEKVSGTWKAQDSAFSQLAAGAQLTTLLKGRQFSEYTIRLKGRKLSGYNAFIIPFAVHDEKNHLRVHIGSYVNVNAVFEFVSDGAVANLSKSVRLEEPIRAGEWYDIRIEVGKEIVDVFLNGELLMRYAEQDRVLGIAGRDNRNGDLVVKVVNAENDACDLHLQLKGKQSKQIYNVEMYTLSADRQAENSFGQPSKYVPLKTNFRRRGNTAYRIPPNSINVIRLR